VPDTNDFDLIASESINSQYNSVLDLTTDEYLKECLDAHNAKRRLHGVDDLVYDEKVSYYLYIMYLIEKIITRIFEFLAIRLYI
jgi:hypothetical protein